MSNKGYLKDENDFPAHNTRFRVHSGNPARKRIMADMPKDLINSQASENISRTAEQILEQILEQTLERVDNTNFKLQEDNYAQAVLHNPNTSLSKVLNGDHQSK